MSIESCDSRAVGECVCVSEPGDGQYIVVQFQAADGKVYGLAPLTSRLGKLVADGVAVGDKFWVWYRRHDPEMAFIASRAEADG